MWYECKEDGCGFMTNSPREATKHEDKTGHKGTTEGDE